MYKSCVDIKTITGKTAKTTNKLILTSSDKSLKDILKNENLTKFQKDKIKKLDGKSGFTVVENQEGYLGVLHYQESEDTRPGECVDKAYAYYRNQVHKWLSRLSGEESFEIENRDDSEEALRGALAGVELCNYSFKNEIKKWKIYLDKKDSKAGKEAVKKAAAVNVARFLVDQPANQLSPKAFKSQIEKEFAKEEGFKVKTLERAELKKKGYGLITGVGQGYDEGPYLVHVSYRTSKKSKIHLGGVGKGITFDTGGLDVKPAQFMRWMKKDMGGAGSLYGFLKWIKDFKPSINVDFVFAIAENSVSTIAFRPGDILKAYDGTTVEIHNTDAEGRLAMASGYNYLNTLNIDFDVCFNLATLTGAIKAGLGDRMGGLFSNSQELADSLMEHSQKTGDPVWLMPIPHWTKNDLKSSVADMANCGSGYGGAISAAEFLRTFASQKKKWFHMDLYCWTDSPRDAFRQKGGTGQGVQLLQSWVESL